MSEQTLSDDERAELLDLYDGLRVADVVDGLDYHGFHDLTWMSSAMGPLWEDTETFNHQLMGFAYTARYLPTNQRREGLPPVEERDYETYQEWADEWWEDVSPDPSTDDVRENDVVVVEAHDVNVGIFGPFNTLTLLDAGAVGVVTDGGPRDTDEVAKQEVSVYCREVNKTIPPGRVELDAEQVPVNVDGVQVEPEDLVVADGDGVVVVPVEHAEEVGKTARAILEQDQEYRAGYYDRLGMDDDFTLGDG